MSRHAVPLLLAVVTPLIAADRPNTVTTAFSGWYEIERGVAEATIRSEREWTGWRARIPRRVPGRTKGLDAVNDNPVLTRRVDWKTQMVVTVAAADAVPTIVRTVVRDGTLVVEYRLVDDFSSRPIGWGHQASKIVPRSPGKVVYRVVKPAAE